MKEKYRISVGEPWDYENEIGKNIITGHVVKRVSNRCAVFVSDIPLEFGNDRGNILVLFNRYGPKDKMEELDGMTINGGLLLADFADDLDEGTLEKNSRFVITGGLEKY